MTGARGECYNLRVKSLLIFAGLFLGAGLVLGQEKPPETHAQPQPKSYERVAKVSCRITVTPHVTEVWVFNARTKKNEMVRTEHQDDVDMVLQMKDKDDAVVWDFGPVAHPSEDEAISDCLGWKKQALKNLKAYLETKPREK